RDLTGDGVFDEADVLASASELGTTKVVFDLGLGDLLTVTKTGGATTADVLAGAIVEVVLNQPPIFGSPVYVFEVPADSQPGAEIGQVTATDPDGPSLTYRIAAGDESGNFEIDAADGTLTVSDTADFDSEVDTEFSLLIEVTDGTTPVTVTTDILVTSLTPLAAADDSAFAFADSIVVDVLANDYGPAGSNLRVVSVENGIHGSTEIVRNIPRWLQTEFELDGTFASIDDYVLATYGSWESLAQVDPSAGRLAVRYIKFDSTFSGEESFSYVIETDSGRQATGRLTVFLQPGLNTPSPPGPGDPQPVGPGEWHAFDPSAAGDDFTTIELAGLTGTSLTAFSVAGLETPTLPEDGTTTADDSGDYDWDDDSGVTYSGVRTFNSSTTTTSTGDPLGVWTYTEVFWATFTANGASADGSSTVSTTGFYGYTLNAGGSPDSAYFDFTATTIITSNGSNIIPVEGGSVTHTWLDTLNHKLTIGHSADFVSGLMTGHETESGNNTYSHTDSGSYLYSIDGGSVDGTVGGKGLETTDYSNATFYSRLPNADLSRSGFSTITTTSNASDYYAGSGSFSRSGSHGDRVYNSRGSAEESGASHDSSSSNTTAILTTAGWSLVSGIGFAYGGSTNSTGSVTNGGYTQTIEGGSLTGSFDASSKSDSSANYRVYSVYDLLGGWSVTGVADTSGDASAESSYNG
ncbi:MAG: cadherin repeat domain-containing protein, partial [Planctomycetota bacterium]